jgi:hypothetical protein
MKVGVPLIVAALCWFVLVIAHGWVMRALPSSGNVVFFLLGLTVVGAVSGFLVSSAANIILRAAPQKLRMSLSAVAWLAFVVILVRMLLSAGADAQRTFVASGITAACGLLVGPYYAELLIGAWFVKRLARRQSSNS